MATDIYLYTAKHKNKYPTSYELHVIAEELRDVHGHKAGYFSKDSIRPAIRVLAQQRLEGRGNHEASVPVFVVQDEAQEYPASMLREMDNIMQELLDECTLAFGEVMYTAVIDVNRDPNAIDTPRRLAKMYINELMGGRYYPAPKITAFPNDNNGSQDLLYDQDDVTERPSREQDEQVYHFNNLLVVQSPFTSVCSHHWQPVNGTAYIGIIPGKKVIGLSKYTRIVQHIAARGTLQEELTVEIANALQHYTETDDIAVTIFARHGCCENRGIRVPNSQTSTAEMRGLFMEKGKLREEFYDNVKMMRRESCSK